MNRNDTQKFKGRTKGRKATNSKSRSDNQNDRDFTERASKQTYNDASWYYKHDQQAKDVASISFNDAIGSVTTIDHPGSAYAAKFSLNLPGIMAIYAGPSVGPSYAPTSPINIAARDIYGFVRHQNSGHSNYDSTDLMLYIMAMDSVYSMISYMQRIVGLCNVFSTTNRYVGDAMLIAMGVRPAEVRANLANFTAFLNQYVVKTSAFCVPAKLNLFRRHYWMYSGVYKDEPVAKSQFYMYVPAYLWQYNVDLEGKGFLDPLPVVLAATESSLESRSLSIAEVQSLANALLDQLQYSEDCNIMSGDILKAYGAEGVWTMQLISPDYSVAPVYSEEILDQIHNTTFTGVFPVNPEGAMSLDQLSVHQVVTDTASSPYLTHEPYFKYAHHLAYSKVLDLHNENPTPEEILVATRNVAIGDYVYKEGDATWNNKRIHKLTACGSDICISAKIYNVDSAGTLQSTPMYQSDDYNTSYGEAREQMLTKFNKYPTYLWYEGSVVPASQPGGIGGEIDNYAVIGHVTLKAMHETAMLSLLGVPNSSRIKG